MGFFGKFFSSGEEKLLTVGEALELLKESKYENYSLLPIETERGILYKLVPASQNLEDEKIQYNAQTKFRQKYNYNNIKYSPNPNKIPYSNRYNRNNQSIEFGR